MELGSSLSLEKISHIEAKARAIKLSAEEAQIYRQKLEFVFKLPKELKQKLERGEITEREYQILEKSYASIREYEKAMQEYVPKYLEQLISIANNSLSIYSELTGRRPIGKEVKLKLEKTLLRVKGIREKPMELPMEKELPVIKVKKVEAPTIRKELKKLEKPVGFKLAREFVTTPFYMLGNSIFGEIYDRYREKFAGFESTLRKAGVKILPRTYISTTFFLTWFAFLCSVVLFLILYPRFRNPLLIPLVYSLPLIMFSIFYFYPFYKASERKKNINTHLPFALTHMGATASSGLSPYHLFRILADSEEYGELRKESLRIVGMSDDLGLDVVTSIKNVSATTPSENFSKFLLGMSSTIETGGDIRKFLEVEAQKALFEYELRRRKYHELLSTYADIYAAVAVAAPLFLVAALTLMNVLGGRIFGFSIEALLWLGTYVLLPFINIVFILFIEMTQPQI